MGLIFFAFAWLLPNHYPPWVNFHSEFLAFLGLGAMLGTFLWRPAQALRLPLPAMALLVLAAAPWLQHAAGLVFFAGDALVSSYYLVGLAVAITLGYSCTLPAGSAGSAPEAAGLLPFAMMLLAAALLSAVLGFLQWLSLTDALTTAVMHLEPGERVMASLGQPNQLASLLLMGMVALAFVFERRGIGRLGLFLGTTFMTWVIVLTGSRTAILSALAIVLFLLFKKRSGGSLLPAGFLGIWFAGFVLATLAMPSVNELLLLSDGRDVALTDSNGRVMIWQQTVAAIAEAPWLGYGWNQTPVAQATGALQYPGTLFFSNAHNLVLDLCTWVGLPLGIALSAACAYWLCTRMKWAHTTEAVYAMAMLLPVAVHSMLEFPFAYAYFLLAAGLLMGVVEASTVVARPFNLSVRAGWGVLALLAAIGGYQSYEYILVEEDYRVARFENLRVGRTPEDYRAPVIRLSTQLKALLSVLRQPAVPAMTAAQMESLRQVSLRFGFRPLVFRYAVALGLNDDPAGASRQMQVLRGMYGEHYYQATKMEMERLAAAEYPQLSAVRLP